MDEPDASVERDPEELRRRLRGEMVAFVNDAGARRVLSTVFHVGLPGGRRGRDQIAVPEEAGYDAGLRADLVERCLDVLAPTPEAVPLPWVTRSGDLVAHDQDVAWAAAAREGFARHGLPFPGFFVITRQGWLNLSTCQATTEQVRRRRRRRTTPADHH